MLSFPQRMSPHLLCGVGLHQKGAFCRSRICSCTMRFAAVLKHQAVVSACTFQAEILDDGTALDALHNHQALQLYPALTAQCLSAEESFRQSSRRDIF